MNDKNALFEQWNRDEGSNKKAKTPGEEIFAVDRKEDSKRNSCCNGRGFKIVGGKPVKCDVCHGVVGEKVIELSELSKDDVNKELDRLGVPSFNRGKDFSPSELKNSESISMDARNDMAFEMYVDKLHRVYDRFVMGSKLSKSYLVMAPQGYGKLQFVYSCMEEAIKMGWKVAPFYDTDELVELYHKKGTDERFAEVLESDVVFIKLIPAMVSSKDTQILKFILDKRARRGKPTVATSRFNMEYLKQIEMHLGNNLGLTSVQNGDFTKMEGIQAPYPKQESKRNWSK